MSNFVWARVRRQQCVGARRRIGADARRRGSPGHSWQNVAAAGSPIAHKGMLVAAKVLALSMVELLQNPQVLKEAKSDLQERMRERKYTTLIPKVQKAPKSIR